MGATLEALSNDLTTATERAGRHVVAIHARRRIPSSGVLWRPGIVVAADHTVHRDDDVRVTLGDGSETRAAVVGRDPSTDLCALRLADVGADAASLGRSPLRVGQLALALGRPGSAVTASLGIVSAIGPEWRTWRGGRVDQFVRLDVAIYDGFSGGPIVDAAGDVVGIATSGLARAAAVAIPVVTVDRVLDRLLAGGPVRPGYLGIATQPVRLPDALRERLPEVRGRLPDGGLMIVGVERGGPGDAAGVLLGDVLVALGDTTTSDPRDVLAALGPETVGTDVRALVVRAGAPLTIDVRVGEHPGR